MANERRRLSSFRSGTITDNPLTVGATTMNSAALAAFDVVASEEYRPIVLDPLGAGNGPEVVYITEHTSGATVASIVRGRTGEGGVAAAQHASGTAWVHAPLSMDVEQLVDVSERPSATGLPYVAQRVFESEAPYKGWRYLGGAWVPVEHDGAWEAFTPTWSSLGTQPAINNGTLSGRVMKVGRAVTIVIWVQFGSTTNGGSGAYSFALPYAAQSTFEQQIISKAFVNGATNYGGLAYIIAGGSTVAPYLPFGPTNATLGAARNSITGAVNEGLPLVAGNYTWVTGYNLLIQGTYEAAA